MNKKQKQIRVTAINTGNFKIISLEDAIKNDWFEKWENLYDC